MFIGQVFYKMKGNMKIAISIFAILGSFLMLSIAFVQPITAMKIESSDPLKICDDFELSIKSIVEDENILSFAERLSENKEIIALQSQIKESSTEEELEFIHNELTNILEKLPDYRQAIEYLQKNYEIELNIIGNNLDKNNLDGFILFLKIVAAILSAIGFGFDTLSSIFYFLPGFWISRLICELTGGAFFFSALFLRFVIAWLENQENLLELGKPTGTKHGTIGRTYEYSAKVFHPSGKDIKYGWDWDGDLKADEWTDFHKSGEKATVSHKFTSPYTGQIRIKILDRDGGMSSWSDPLAINMPRDKLLLFEKIQILLERWNFPILTKLTFF